MNFLKRRFLNAVLIISIGLLVWSIVQAHQLNKLTEEAGEVAEEASLIAQEITYEETTPTTTCLGEYTITGYCACEKCCGKWAKDRPDNIVLGASGKELTSGYSVASNGFDFGTVLEIEGLGIVEVQDRTSSQIDKRYDGKVIDIYFSSHEDALSFGKQTRNVSIFS